MLHKNVPQIVFLLALFSAIYPGTHSLPGPGTYSSIRLGNLEGDENSWANSPADSPAENYKLYYDSSNTVARPTRHADGLFTSGYSKLLGQLSARRYLESLIGKRIGDDLVEDHIPVKRHSDAVFTDNFSRFRKQMAVKKYLDSVLTGKRSPEDLTHLQSDSSRPDPSFQESFDDVAIDELLSHLPLVSASECTLKTRPRNWV
uniref:Acylphosphatase-2-like n=1 Tax=Scleropages formosus TaxID=113540 RepID=A0A8C9V9L5_SCLFO